jgi:hypothetical protein
VSHEKIVSIVSIAGSFILMPYSAFNFIVACFALALFAFICFIEKKESNQVKDLLERVNKLDEKVSIQFAFGGKR